MKNLIITIVLVMVGTGIYYVYTKLGTKDQVSTRTLIVATDATYPPLESLNERGEMVGFDIDLISEMAKEIKVETQLKNVPFVDIFGELENGKVDMIVSAVTITSERLAKYAFSVPYFNAGQVIVVRSDSAVTGLRDLVGKKIGAQVETTSLTEATKLTESKLVASYANYSDAVKDLIGKEIDAIVVDLPAGVGIVQENSSLKVVGEPFTQEFYGVVVLRSNKELLSKINESIASLKRSGKIVEIRDKWKL